MTVPIGTIMAYAGDNSGSTTGKLAQKGWLICNGEEYSIDDYPELNEVIGTYFGTASRAGYFKLPDLQGCFLRGVDNGSGRDPDAKSRTALANGGNTGDKVGSYQDDGFRQHNHSHSHQLTINAFHETKQGTWEGDPIALAGYPQHPSNKTFTTTNDQTNVGGNETRPKNIYVNYIIKAKNV
jgi:microcystin-dependent protein